MADNNSTNVDYPTADDFVFDFEFSGDYPTQDDYDYNFDDLTNGNSTYEVNVDNLMNGDADYPTTEDYTYDLTFSGDYPTTEDYTYDFSGIGDYLGNSDSPFPGDSNPFAGGNSSSFLTNISGDV